MPPSRAYQRARSSNAARSVKTARREQRVLELRAAGYTFSDIGQKLNISTAAAEAAFSQGLAKIPVGGAKEERGLQLQRIGWMRSRLWACLDRPTAKGEGKPTLSERCPTCGSSPNFLAAADKVIRLEERLARLLGLDRSTKVDRRSLGAPAVVPIDLKSRTEAIERLSVDEQRELLFLDRYGPGNGDFVLVVDHAASFRPTASRSWSRSSAMR